jgi:hypothetical protein
MTGALNHWFVVLAIDKATIHGFIEGVVPATYKPMSEAVWCMCKADSKERAIEMAKESFADGLASGETLDVVSVARLWDVEAVS